MKSSKQAPAFATIKAHVTIDMVLEHYGATLEQKSNRWVGHCPIHKGSAERTFTVTPNLRSWFCFCPEGNKTGGSVLDLVAALEDCSLHEAAVKLNERFKVIS